MSREPFGSCMKRRGRSLGPGARHVPQLVMEAAGLKGLREFLDGLTGIL